MRKDLSNITLELLFFTIYSKPKSLFKIKTNRVRLLRVKGL